MCYCGKKTEQCVNVEKKREEEHVRLLYIQERCT
jgi:hypothetical protein